MAIKLCSSNSFNVKVSNFLATFLGIVLKFFISSIAVTETIIDNNLLKPEIKDIITTPEIYLPLLAFFFLILIMVILKKFYQND